MAKKGVEIFQPKITRNDRFAQMSHQEKIIEQKKKEIQLKLEAKQKLTKDVKASTTTTTTATTPSTNNNNNSINNNQIKSKSNTKEAMKTTNGFNMFTNDGSFLDQFKQMKEKKLDNTNYKQQTFIKSSNNNEKPSRWLPRRRSTSPKQLKNRTNFDQKITINTSFAPPPLLQQKNIIGQPLMKNLMPPPPVGTPTFNNNETTTVLLNVPPPQLITPNTLVLPSTSQNMLVTGGGGVGTVLSTVLTQDTATFTPCTIELSTIPPPHPIQVQNIPQPEPINAINIPPPAPIQVQNIPTPTTIQLNEIPPPKPLDLLQIPTPLDEKKTENDFSIPPPNKSIPPPNLQDNNVLLCVPPPSASTTVAPPPPPPPPPPSTIPSLMAQAILPPQLANVNCPPPTILSSPPPPLPPPPPGDINTAQMPPMNVPPPTAQAILFDMNTVFAPGTQDYESMVTLARMVAQCGSSFEDVVKQRKNQEPNHWFLFHKESAAYRQYKMLIEQFKNEFKQQDDNLYKPEDIYEPEMATDDYLDAKTTKRKRKSRWGDKEINIPPPAVHDGTVMLSKVTRNDPNLVQYVINTFGSTNLTDDEWKKAEDHYKINLLYQDMVRKREQVERLKLCGKNKYDYDSDEECDGGTWEHKLREKEMMATQLWAQELNRQAEGKHHIGDFLPPDELKRFMEKTNASKDGRQLNFSDYKEFKIKEDNIGFKMLQKLGWNEGQGLGTNSCGIVEPVNKATSRDHHQGLGLNESDDNEDEYESYRKRMMLAYRFRPNPLNNPRRPYY